MRGARFPATRRERRCRRGCTASPPTSRCGCSSGALGPRWSTPGCSPIPTACSTSSPPPSATPEAQAITRDALGLAYIAAMQLLPPRQRAVLALRDGLGWPASDVADLLGDSVPAVNSALQRARGRIAREREAGTLARLHAPRSASAEAAAVREFVAAWAAVDIPRIVALLHDDALLTMPPVAMRFEGSTGDRRVLRHRARGWAPRPHPSRRSARERATRPGQLHRRRRRRPARGLRRHGPRHPTASGSPASPGSPMISRCS